MAKKKHGWTAVYESCPDVDGGVYATRKAVIEAHGKSVVGEGGIAKIVRKEFPEKPKPVKRPKSILAWMLFSDEHGWHYDVCETEKEAIGMQKFEKRYWGNDCEVVRIEIRPAKGAKRDA